MKSPQPSLTKRLSGHALARMGAIMNRALGAVSNRVHVAAANMWRDQYNPLRALTIARAVHLLEEGERGAYADLQWTYRFIEMQDATLGALVERRTSAIQQLSWNIKVNDDLPDDKKQVAEKQQAALKAAYEKITNLSAAFEALVMASFRGYAHLEKVTDGNGDVVELAPVDQWFWCRLGIYGDWAMNPQAKFGLSKGDPVPLPRFMIREVTRPINRVALIAFIRKSLSQKDWDGFVETYGIPAVFVIMPDQIPADKEDEYLQAAEAVTSDARGVLPGGSEIKTVDNGARANNPFKDHLAYQDEQMILRGTGGLLTMLTQSGSGTLAGGAHADTFAAIARAEAAEISEIFRSQLDAEILAKATPGEAAYAYFELAANEEMETSSIIKDVRYLASAGYQIDPTWLEEKTGYQLAKQPTGAAAPGAATEVRNREQNPAKDWKNFSKETGTLGIPRSIMPQVQHGNRAAMVNFLRARGVGIKRTEIKPSDMKPTQAEYSPSKVASIRDAGVRQRPILISNDHHVVDGHHQYRAALETAANQPIPALQIQSPIMHVLGLLLMMPSTSQEETVRNRKPETAAATPEERPAWMDALAKDMSPLGEALQGALQAGDQAATVTALKRISEQMPDFLATTELDACLEDLFGHALVGDEESIRNGRWMTVKGHRFYKLDKGESREPKDKASSIQDAETSRRDPRPQEEITRQKDIMSQALAAANRNEGGVIDLAAMPEGARHKVAEAIGRDNLVEREITYQVEPQRLRHKQISHGAATETERGQRPLTDDDIIRRLPLVLADPDTVALSEKTGDNDLPRLVFSRRIDAKHTVIVELRESRRRETRAIPITHYVSNRTRPMFSPDCTSLTVVRAWTREDLP